ncbi:TPA: HEPN domain-containing protein [Burkholderia cenocepacia]
MDYRNIELPAAASDGESGPFEPRNKWLKRARPEEQKAAMLRWFLERYEDPANETPWDSEDGEYVFVWGGPYDPNDEIQARFGGIVEYSVMADVISDLHMKVGHEWAPIEHEGVDYEDYLLEWVVTTRDDPKAFLEQRLNQIDSAISAVAENPGAYQIVHQMAHGSIIAALEAFLADTVKFWVTSEESVLRRFVSTNKDFQKEVLNLRDIFTRYDRIKADVHAYLSEFMWHRLDKVKPIIKSAFQIDVPDISTLMAAVKVRHDIVHRAGRNSEGVLVILTTEDIHALRDECRKFADAIAKGLEGVFPVDGPNAWIPPEPARNPEHNDF